MTAATETQKKQAGVSVVVTCLNEAATIASCLESLLGQSYHHMEIIVVDGGSCDGTAGIVQTLAAADLRLKLVVDEKKGAAAGRNRGIREAGHELVAFTDADCAVPADWLAKLVRGLYRARRNDPAIIAVGGGNISAPDAPSFVRAITIALDSFPGSFASVQGRRFDLPRPVESLASLNVLYIKDALRAIDGYDESLASEAEDADLNYRLTEKGCHFLYLPDSFVWHHMRATPAAWYANMKRYGRGRARLLKRHPAMWRPSFLLPPLFLAAMLSTVLFFLAPIFLLPLVYFPSIAIYSSMLARRAGQPRLMALVFLVFCIQHFGYALGESAGLLNPAVR